MERNKSQYHIDSLRKEREDHMRTIWSRRFDLQRLDSFGRYPQRIDDGYQEVQKAIRAFSG